MNNLLNSIEQTINSNIAQLVHLQIKESDGTAISQKVVNWVIVKLCGEYSASELQQTVTSEVIAHIMRLDWQNNFISSAGYAGYYDVPLPDAHNHIKLIREVSNQYQKKAVK